MKSNKESGLDKGSDMKTQSFKGEYFMKIGILERRNLSVDCCLVSVVNSLDQLKKKKTSKKKKKTVHEEL